MELNGTTRPTLRDLIDTCRAGEYQFRHSALQTNGADLKQLFAWRADEFAQLANELRQRGDGVHCVELPDMSRTSAEPFEARDDATLLDACGHSEAEALTCFDSALTRELSPTLRALLADERDRRQRHHLQLHSLRSRLIQGG